MKRFLLAAAFLLLNAGVALATQEHADPEGLYSHQIAHLFFMFAMIFLMVQIARTSPLHRGWKLIGWAAFVFLLWNIDVFTVHWIRESITSGMYRGSAEQWTRELDITTFKAKVFYFGKIIDHVLTVLATAIFIMGIKAFTGDEDAGEKA